MKINTISILRNLLLHKASDLQLDYTPDLVMICAERDYVHFNIHSRNTFKYSLRLKDMRVIPEGCHLGGYKGLTLNQVYSKVSQDLTAHAKRIKLLDKAEKKNAIVFDGYLVPCKGFSIL